MFRATCALLLLMLPAPRLGGAEADQKKHLLFLGASRDWAHDSVSHAMYTMEKIGQESGLFDVRFHTDTELLTKRKLGSNKKNLDYFDALIFFTQGDLPLTGEQKADVMSFIRQDGKGFLGVHSATDSFRASWPEYIEMVGGAFDNHPWHQTVRVRVADRSFPATKHFPAFFEITDEVYQLNRYSRQKQRVLMSLDVSSVDLKAKGVHRTDGDFALAWARSWGKGRVFVSLLGHSPGSMGPSRHPNDVAGSAARWVLGFTDAKLTPLPKPTE